MMCLNNLSPRWCRVMLGAMVSMTVLVGTCHAAGQEKRASGERMLAISGDIGAEIGHIDANLGSDYGYGTGIRLQLDLQPLRNLAFTTRVKASYADSSDLPHNGLAMVDRCYVSLRDIGIRPLGFAVGRLPTMGESSPGYLKQGLDHPRGWLSSFADIALDGAAIEYHYQVFLPGQVRLYYATQTDTGYEENFNESGLAETTIYGLQWDIALTPSRSIQLQSLLIADIWNAPDNIAFVNPLEFALWGDSGFFDPEETQMNLILDRKNLGDIYQTGVTYLDKYRNLNLFVSLGWSHTNPTGVDELGASLLGSWWDEPKNRDGYSVYVGLRYDLDRMHSIGFEYNYGSKYWVNFTQEGSDNAKLGTRGSVTEVYWTVRPPLPEVLAGPGRLLVGRVGYQYIDYQYTGSNTWLGEPIKIDSLLHDPLSLQFYTPLAWANTIYASVELYF